MEDTHPLPRRIDVHSHFLPEDYRTALAQNGHLHPDGMPEIPQWSLEAHLEMMKLANISKSILSISSPGVSIVANNPRLTETLTRLCNAHAASLKETYPDRFGFWASLPLPEVDASLKEMETALAEGADGIALLTNYHGNYLGAPIFDPIFEKLNEIGATVFIHPTMPCLKCTGHVDHGTAATPLAPLYPVPMFEFLFDTARAVINLFCTGTISRCPNIRFILPHVGGTFPPLLLRMAGFTKIVPGGRILDETETLQVLGKQFYFDLAGLPFAAEEAGQGQAKALIEGFGISSNNLLYGSDFPFTPAEFVAELAGKMKRGLEALFVRAEREAIYEKNAIELLNRAK